MSQPTTTQDKAMKRFGFTVHGTVQGVGFRQFTRKKAIAHGVTGWCRNSAEGTVEGEAQADADGLDAFFKDVDAGPAMADVTGLDRQVLDTVGGEDSFKIRH